MVGSRTEKADRAPVPIVVVVYHREKDTRRMLEQLARVTDGYALVLVNNGYDDPEFLNSLDKSGYLENSDNVGAIRAINQGLDMAEGQYLCVLHNDLLIFEEGWLDHIVGFMERRPDVGLVGLAGRHTVNDDGTLDYETTVVNMARYQESFRPTWRFTEVAAIDGLGWVMRNIGLRLDEGFGLMHYYDIDLSLQYIEAGYRVYAAAVEIDHIAEVAGRSTRDAGTYLEAIGGDDDAYFDRARERFKSKWGHVLPLTRGDRDEAYVYNRVEELREQYRDLEKHALKLADSDHARGVELEEAATYARYLESVVAEKHEELTAALETFGGLELELESVKARQASLEEALTAARSAAAPPAGAAHRLLFHLGRDGFMSTMNGLGAYIRARLGRRAKS
jgi:glycosyltransferase involved in cell wall biosynthesis